MQNYACSFKENDKRVLICPVSGPRMEKVSGKRMDGKRIRACVRAAGASLLGALTQNVGHAARQAAKKCIHSDWSGGMRTVRPTSVDEVSRPGAS